MIGTYTVLHDPGKNLDGTAVPVRPGPQSHAATVPPNTGAVQVAQVVEAPHPHGFSVTVPSAPPPIAVEVINTSPNVPVTLFPSVVTDVTYFEPEPTDTSQPQPLSATVAVLADD